MAIVYVMAHWSEEDTEYIGITESGQYFWTPFLEQALCVNKIFDAKIPEHLNWLPVFIPDIPKESKNEG